MDYEQESMMTEQAVTFEQPQQGFTADTFAAFWAKPDLSSDAVSVLDDDVVGYWPGEEDPVRGSVAYVAALRELLVRVPDLALTVAESATDDENIFIRWVAHATGADGQPIEHTGIDRIKVRDGRVIENRIFFDRPSLERKLGISLDLL